MKIRKFANEIGTDKLKYDIHQFSIMDSSLD